MSRFVRSFREVDVYQAALTLAREVHEFCHLLPPVERYALADQMRRASRSVCSNLSEAWRKRRYRPAFIAKLNDAESEAAEMQAWFDVARQSGYLQQKQYIDWVCGTKVCSDN